MTTLSSASSPIQQLSKEADVTLAAPPSLPVTAAATTRIHRYVPPSISLQSDVPGYYDHDNFGRDVSTIQSDTSTDQRHLVIGPICWKCHGAGTRTNTKRKEKRIKVTNATTNTTSESNEHVLLSTTSTAPTSCTICMGIGRLVRQQPSNSVSNSNVDGVGSRCNSDVGGTITRGRRRRLCSTSDELYTGIEPVGYQVPFYGPLVQRATKDCVDINIIRLQGVESNDNSNNVNGNESHFNLKITIGNRKKSISDVLNDKVDGDVIMNNYINEDDNDAIIEMKRDVVNVTTIPIWLPIQPNIQLCNFVGHWRILQYMKSHRYTTDDLVTAVIACRECFNIVQLQPTSKDVGIDTKISPMKKKNNISYCDLGTGNGSVLQMILWKCFSAPSSSSPTTTKEPIFHQVIGLEARYEAIQLARRSLAFNIGTVSITSTVPTKNHEVPIPLTRYNNEYDEVNDDTTNTTIRNKVSLVHTDFRSFASNYPHYQKQFDIITGTPPYFQVDFHIEQEQQQQIDDDIDNSNYDIDANTNINYDDSKKNNSCTTNNITNNNTDSSGKIIAKIRQGGMPIKSIQSAPARCEFRGGIEEYCSTAYTLLKDNLSNNNNSSSTGSMLCICENYSNHDRAIKAFINNHFQLIKYYVIEGKVGRGPLFCVYVVQKAATTTTNSQQSNNVIVHHLAVRDMNGEFTKEYQRMVLDYMSIQY